MEVSSLSHTDKMAPKSAATADARSVSDRFCIKNRGHPSIRPKFVHVLIIDMLSDRLTSVPIASNTC